MDKSKAKTKRTTKIGIPQKALSTHGSGAGAYPVEPDVLEEQQRRLKNAAAAAVQALKAAPVSNPDRLARVKPGSQVPSKSRVGQTARMVEPASSRLASCADTVRVSFTFHCHGATSVSLCGEFNNWSPESTPMKIQRGGYWEAVLELAPGRYQYKFVVEGDWLSDPLAKESVPNEHGSQNSVIEVIRQSDERSAC